MTSLPRDLGDYLREQREHAKLSLRQLAEVADVSNPYLSQIERGLKRPSADILQSLAKGLRISAESLYVRAGMLEERDEHGVSLEAAILTEPVLSERQKRVLLDIYESFRAENARAGAEAASASDQGDEPDAPGPAPVVVDATADLPAPDAGAPGLDAPEAAAPPGTEQVGPRPRPRKRAPRKSTQPTSGSTS